MVQHILGSIFIFLFFTRDKILNHKTVKCMSLIGPDLKRQGFLFVVRKRREKRRSTLTLILNISTVTAKFHIIGSLTVKAIQAKTFTVDGKN